MNEALQSALASLIAKLTDTITNVGGAVADQIPTLVTQMIGFQIMKYWIWVGVEGFIVVTFPIIIYWSIGYVRNEVKSHEEAKKIEAERKDPFYTHGNAWFCAILGIIWAWSGISIVQDVIQLIKLYNFPLVWILDYLKELTAK